MNSDLVDIEVILLHETDKAYLVQLNEDADKIWIPKSQCEVFRDEVVSKDVVVLQNVWKRC